MGMELQVLGAFVSAAGQMQAASGIESAGEYNRQIGERNEKVAEQKAEMRIFQASQEALRFSEEFRSLNDASMQAMRFNGVVGSSGTSLDVAMNNALEAEKDIQTMKMNAARDASDMREEGVNARLKGELSAYEAKAQAKAMRIGAMGSLFSSLA
jgi:hypothetical protein